MTYREIYTKCLETIRNNPVIDYRPNSAMYTDDLQDRVGIRLWFENGDSVIYFSRGVTPEQPEVIRCKDCVHRMEYDGNPICGINVLAYIGKDDFCSRAERKEG